VTDFAAAVAAARAAVAAFDRGEPVIRADGAVYVNNDCPGRPPDLGAWGRAPWLDWNAIREPMVLAEEAALERDFGCGTRSAGGGGERLGRAPAREMPTADFRPTHARVRDALRKLGTATAREITVEAKTSHAAGGWLTEALKRGEVEHDGGYPRRYRWVGPAPLPAADRELVDEARDLMAGGMTLRKVCERFRSEGRKLAGREVTPALLMKAMRVNGERPAVNAAADPVNSDRPSVNAEAVEVNNAADEPQEVRKMPTGTKIDEAKVLEQVNIAPGPWTSETIATRLGCVEGTAADWLRKLSKAGKVVRSLGPKPQKGKRPVMWGPRGTGMIVPAALAKKAKREIEACGKPAASTSLAALLEREVERAAMLRAAAILRAHADAIEAEAGSAA
jgi:hypothetical protein